MIMLYTGTFLWCVLFIGSVLSEPEKPESVYNSYLLPEVMDAGLYASSVSKFESTGPQRARLGDKWGAWCPNTTTNNPYIQVEFSELKSITRVVTQGSNSKSEWVSTYEMAYSNTNCSSYSFTYIPGNKVFRGNQDEDSMVRNVLETPVLAKCVRLYPRTWHGNPSLRFDLQGNPARCYSRLLPGVDDFDISDSLAQDYLYDVRLDTDYNNAWCAGEQGDHWIQVKFLEHKSITTILTQGEYGKWVSAYRMSYSIDNACNSDSFTFFGTEAAFVFTGNRDRNTVVENVLDTPVVAKCVRLRPKTWHRYTCLRFELEGCQANDSHCNPTRDLLQDVSNSALTASSVFNNHHHFVPPRARLHTQAVNGGRGPKGAWCSRHRTVNEWLQVEFQELMTITKIKTQGRSDQEQWVTSYQMSYSTDCKTFAPYLGPKTFNGNEDSKLVVRNFLPYPVVAKCVRVHPESFTLRPCLLLDVEGCTADSSDAPWKKQ